MTRRWPGALAQSRLLRDFRVVQHQREESGKVIPRQVPEPCGVAEVGHKGVVQGRLVCAREQAVTVSAISWTSGWL